MIRELETHLKTFKERLEEMNNLKSKVTELMVKRDERINNIEEWSSKHEAEVEENDVPIQELQTNKKELKEEKMKKEKQERQKKIRLRKSTFIEAMVKKNNLKS